MRRNTLLSILAPACLMPLAPAQAALPPGITGSWYNPEQPGHGVSVEILSPERALLFWYTYDAAGNPVNLYVEGAIEGDRIHGPALAPRGMRFGSFDPAELQLPAWGEVSLEFADCDDATLRWNANSSAFGSGETPMRRLTAISGLDCRYDDSASADKGLYSATVTPAFGGEPLVNNLVVAAVDSQGAVWAIDFGHLPEVTPGPLWVSSSRSCVGLGQLGNPSSSSRSTFSSISNNVLAPHLVRAFGCEGLSWQGEPAREGEGFTLLGSPANSAERWSFAPRQDATLITPQSLADLSGDYRFRAKDQFFEFEYDLSIAVDGSLCLGRLVPNEPACMQTGRVLLDAFDPDFFDFELGRTATNPARGRGWLEQTANGRRLVLVGASDTESVALGIVARPL